MKLIYVRTDTAERVEQEVLELYLGAGLGLQETNSLTYLTVGSSNSGLLTASASLRVVGAAHFSPTTDDSGVKIQGEFVTGNNSQRIYFKEVESSALYGFSLIYAGNANPTFDGTAFTLAANNLHIVRHENAAAGAVVLSVARATGAITLHDFTPGDILYVGASDVLSALAIGAAGKIVRSNGTAPVFSSATFPDGATAGRLMYASATDTWTGLAAGAVSSVLTSDGTNPVWTTSPTIGGSLRVNGNIGFYGQAPVAKPTGVAVTAAGIHAALVTLNLIAG